MTKPKINSKIFLTIVLISFAATQLMAQSSGTSSSLSPIPVSIGNNNKTAISLNGEWKFESPNKKGVIKVPGEWVMQGYEVSVGETAVYTRQFNLPNAWEGQRIKLKFEGVSSHGVVKVNENK